MVRARKFGHSIDNEDRSGLYGDFAIHTPDYPDPGEGIEGGRERGERQPGPSTGRGANLCSWIAYSTSDRGGMGWVPPLSVEQGRMGVLSAVRVGGAGGREWSDRSVHVQLGGVSGRDNQQFGKDRRR